MLKRQVKRLIRVLDQFFGWLWYELAPWLALGIGLAALVHALASA